MYRMTITEGEIKNIKDESTESLIKSMVVLKPIDNQCAFIEFRGDMTKSLKSYRIGDWVQITVFLNGKTSKSGINHNNLVAKSINKV